MGRIPYLNHCLYLSLPLLPDNENNEAHNKLAPLADWRMVLYTTKHVTQCQRENPFLLESVSMYSPPAQKNFEGLVTAVIVE